MENNANEKIICFNVLAYPFKQNEYMFLYMKVLLYTYLYNTSLNVLKATFLAYIVDLITLSVKIG